MEQFGWLLSELIQGAVRCADLAGFEPRGRTGVLLPARAASRSAARVVGGDVGLDRGLGREPRPAPGASCSSKGSTAYTRSGRPKANRSRV